MLAVGIISLILAPVASSPPKERRYFMKDLLGKIFCKIGGRKEKMIDH